MNVVGFEVYFGFAPACGTGGWSSELRLLPVYRECVFFVRVRVCVRGCVPMHKCAAADTSEFAIRRCSSSGTLPQLFTQGDSKCKQFEENVTTLIESSAKARPHVRRCWAVIG